MIVKLSPEEYGDLRRKVFAKQNGRCARCGKCRGDGLQLHHRITRGIGGGWRLDLEEFCIGLCPDCHRLEHDGHQIFKLERRTAKNLRVLRK
jgi:5-methylcytosine-specific restriction endonuclease McrA